jgi:hypothetical protein
VLYAHGNAEDVGQVAPLLDELRRTGFAVLGMLDPDSAVRLVGHPAVVELWCAFLDVEADAADASADPGLASRRRARAVALRDAARSLWSATGAADDTERPGG